ncbi:MAG: PQQ-binding-like beta-propeller repeat protein, partial [Planctomycetota bacterium]
DGPILDAPFVYRYPQNSRPAEILYRIHDTVHCLDYDHGARLWNKSVEPPIEGRILADELRYFFGSANGYFYGYRKNSAFSDWQFRTGGPISSEPTIDQGRVAFASSGGSVNGMPGAGPVPEKRWTLNTGAAVHGGVTPFSRWFFVGSTDYKLYCIEQVDGTVYWSFGAEAPIRDTPVVFKYKANQEYAYVISSDGPASKPRRTLFSVPLPKGEVAPVGKADWRKKDVRKVIAVGKKTLYVIYDSSEKTLAGLDIETGEEKFTLSLEGFSFVPTNHADAGRDKNERGTLYLVSPSGSVQAIREKI